jgi:hypothetical protein
MLSKKWPTRVVKLSEMIPDENNSRIIAPEALKGLKASLSRFGMVELIVWNERTGHIIGGHQRHAVMLQNGITEAPAVVVDMSPEEEQAARLTLNNVMIEGEFDEPVMELLSQVEASAPELFDAVRLDDLRDSLERKLQLNKSDPPSDEGDEGSEAEEWDTECPCCQHKWKVDAKDIVVVKGVS